MAKVQIKSERITPFGGIFQVRELFSRFVGPVIDKVLGLRCASYGYQYSEIMDRLDTKAFGLKKTSRIKAFVFKFISVPAKWIRTARHYGLNIYTHNKSYPIHNHVCSGKAIVRWRGKLQNVVYITICCGF